MNTTTLILVSNFGKLCGSHNMCFQYSGRSLNVNSRRACRKKLKQKICRIFINLDLSIEEVEPSCFRRLIRPINEAARRFFTCNN